MKALFLFPFPCWLQWGILTDLNPLTYSQVLSKILDFFFLSLKLRIQCPRWRSPPLFPPPPPPLGHLSRTNHKTLSFASPPGLWSTSGTWGKTYYSPQKPLCGLHGVAVRIRWQCGREFCKLWGAMESQWLYSCWFICTKYIHINYEIKGIQYKAPSRTSAQAAFMLYFAATLWLLW